MKTVARRIARLEVCGPVVLERPDRQPTSRRCTTPSFMMPCMKPEPANAAQRDIVQRIDKKARAIRDGRGRWNLSEILAEMKFAVTHEGNADDDRFAEQYTVWRSQNPLKV